MGASSIYQRTDAGRLEIQLKRQGLTQSERLLLIVVDGRAPLAELGEKLRGLESGRIAAAIDKLAGKQLIFEVLMPETNINTEVVDAVLIDKFLQQDSLDPVTIVSFDPDYGYEEDVLGNERSANLSKNFLSDTATLCAVDKEVFAGVQVLRLMGSGKVVRDVDFYIPLVKGGAVEVEVSRLPLSASAILPGDISLPPKSALGWPQVYRGQIILLSWLLLVAVGVGLVSLPLWGKISRYLGFT